MRSFDLWILDPRRSLYRPAVEFDLEVISLDNTKRQIQLLRKLLRVIFGQFEKSVSLKCDCLRLKLLPRNNLRSTEMLNAS